MMQPKIMIVEDERIVAFNIQQRLAKLGYDVPLIASSGEQALRLAEENDPDLILMDIRIEGEMDGIETASRLNLSHPTPVVYLTAHSEDATLERARATRPYGYLLKPFSEREMHATIQMAIERARVEAVLHQSEEQLRLALDAADMGIMDLNPETHEMELAGHTAKIFELGQHIQANWETMLSSIDEPERERVRTELEDCSRVMGEGYQIEFRRNAADGTQHWISAQGKRYVGRRGERVIGVVQDVTQLKRTEEQLQNVNVELERQVSIRTAELRVNIAELDAFSYSVAHDLRSPVRAIVSFSQIVLESSQDTLEPENAHMLGRVITAAKHMAEMIDALLSLSHITRTPMLRHPVDLSAIVSEFASELSGSHPQRMIEFIIAQNVVANGDPNLLRILLTNLMRNAWKFTSKHDTACIEFGTAMSDTGNTICFVRDDGAGFDMSYATKLFGAFQRMHKTTDFNGTGVGLATVQRIVQRHGGSIWAEAGVEIGACFYFTLSDNK